MVRIRKVCKDGVTAKYVGGRFMITRNGNTEVLDLDSRPDGDAEILLALEAIITRY